jgi:hypothetical protein
MLRKFFASIACISILLLSGRALAQDSKIAPADMNQLNVMEDSMVLAVDSMYNAFIPDTHTAYCERFVKELVRALKLPNSYYYPFDKLKEKINIMYADDNGFRLFNWSISILPSTITSRYYGAIQLPGAQLKLYPLLDHSSELTAGVEDSILTNDKWFGALYYRIMMHEVNGTKVYTMFGLNAASPISNKKVLEPMIITATGATFGAPVFNMASTGPANMRINRFIMEYKKGVQAALNWDDEKKLIYFDRLMSQTNDPNRKYTYVPSGEYDGFRWENERWNYVKDLIPVQELKDGEAPSGIAPEK